MSEQRSFQYHAARFLIGKDADLFIALSRDPVLEHVRSNAFLALFPYISMFIEGSFSWIRMNVPHSEDVTYTNRYYIERTRQHAKLMLDAERSTDDLITLYRELIAKTIAEFHAPHTGRWSWLQHRLQKDLGLFFLDDELLSSTHIAALNTGIYELALAEGTSNYLESGQRLFDISVELGSYTATALRRLDLPVVLDIPPTGSVLPPLTYKDVRAREFYPDIEHRLSADDQGLAPLIIHVISLVNSVRLLLRALEAKHPFAVAKWKFLAAFHAAKNLHLIQTRHYTGNALLDEPIEVIRNLLGKEDIKLLLKWSALRNTLVHYDMRRAIRVPEVLDAHGHNIVEAHLDSGVTYDVYRATVDRALELLADPLIALLIPDKYFRFRVLLK